jgi:hypothetical protein
MNMELLAMVIVVALIAAFIVLLIDKWKWVEWVQVHGNTFFSTMFNCKFCLSFWAVSLVCLLLYLKVPDNRLIFVPLMATPLTRKLL